MVTVLVLTARDLVTALVLATGRRRVQHLATAPDQPMVLARITASAPCHRVRRHARHRVRVDQRLFRHPHLPSNHWQFREKTGPLAPFFIVSCLP